MRSALFGVVVACALVLPAHGRIGQSSPPAWAMNASVIEACSCTMFCQCYFNPRPTEHTAAAEHAGHGKARRRPSSARGRCSMWHNSAALTRRGWGSGRRSTSRRSNPSWTSSMRCVDVGSSIRHSSGRFAIACTTR